MAILLVFTACLLPIIDVQSRRELVCMLAIDSLIEAHAKIQASTPQHGCRVPACKGMRPVRLPQASDSKDTGMLAEPAHFPGSPFAPNMTWDSSSDAIAAINEMLQLVIGE